MDVFELEITEADFKQTELYRAIQSEKPLWTLEAIKKGASINSRDPDDQSSYLHLVVDVAGAQTEQRLTPIVYQLSNAGIDVDAARQNGQTALELAINRELPQMVATLLRVGASTKLKDYRTMLNELKGSRRTLVRDAFDRYEPGLWAAVEAGHCGTVHILVNSWCRINVQKDGRTLMELAKRSENGAEMLSLLDDYQVTIEFVHATLAGDKERMLEFLMDSKPCDPYMMDISHQESGSGTLSPRSLRDTAISLGHLHTLDYLPRDDPDTDADVRGYLGGLTLDAASTLVTKQAKGDGREDDADKRKRKSSSSTQESVGRKSRPSKCKPMKALIPYSDLKSPGTAPSQMPDDIREHSSREFELFAKQLDLLNDSVFADDERGSYERSRLTGSVALRSKTKSRKSVRSAYSVEDSNDYDDQSAPGDIDLANYPRNMVPFQGLNFVSKARDYDKNWKRSSSLRTSAAHSRSKSKEIISKLCVIS